MEETGPRGVHRLIKSTDPGSNSALPCPMTLSKLMDLSESSSIK